MTEREKENKQAQTSESVPESKDQQNMEDGPTPFKGHPLFDDKSYGDDFFKDN